MLANALYLRVLCPCRSLQSIRTSNARPNERLRVAVESRLDPSTSLAALVSLGATRMRCYGSMQPAATYADEQCPPLRHLRPNKVCEAVQTCRASSASALNPCSFGHVGRIWIIKWPRWHEMVLLTFYVVPFPANVTTRMAISCQRDRKPAALQTKKKGTGV